MLLLAVAASLQAELEVERYRHLAAAQMRCGAWGRVRARGPVTDEARREAARHIDALDA